MDGDTEPSSDRGGPSPLDVECVGSKRRAELSCLECVDSSCETHLDLRDALHARKRHKLAKEDEPQERTCPDHDKPLEVYCRTEQQCICHLCLLDKHRGHEVVAIKKEVAEKKIKLVKLHQQIIERIQTWKKKEHEMKQALKAFKVEAVEAVERSQRAFTELIHSVKGRRRTVMELICAKQEAVVEEAEELLQRVRQEIGDLKRRASELEHLETLSHSGIHFLQRTCSLSKLTKDFQIPVPVGPPFWQLQHVTMAVLDLIQQLDILFKWRFITISERVNSTSIVSSPLPTTWQEFMRYATKLTIDPNTVHAKLCLSKPSELTAVLEPEDYPSHSDRFERRLQALCGQALCGPPRYWEVVCGSGGLWVCIAVSYKGIRRSGRKAPLFGRCHQSWGLRKMGSVYDFWHDNKSVRIASSFRCSRVGVYLDHGAGILAFYNVTDNMSLIHKVQTKFTEPVYAGFGLVGVGSKIKLCF